MINNIEIHAPPHLARAQETFQVIEEENVTEEAEQPSAEKSENFAKIPQYAHNFQSGIFETYHLQLQKFIQEQLEQKPNFVKEADNSTGEDIFHQECIKFIRFIQSPIGDTPEAHQVYHEQTINQLRVLIAQKETQVSNTFSLESIQLIDALSKWMYTGAELKESIWDFMKTTSYFSDPTDATIGNLVEIIAKTHKSIKEGSPFVGATKNDVQDAHQLGSLPFKAFHLSSSKTQVVHMVRVTQETITNDENRTSTGAEVVSEFIDYLEDLKAQDQTHLYVNLMKRKEEKGFREQMGTQAIENLEDDPRVKGTIFVASLDKNSDFYKQKKNENPELADEFKQTFLNRLFDAELDAYHWPQKLLEEGKGWPWKAECEKIINEVHTLFFDQAEQLEAPQRREFIDITYTRLIKSMCAKLDIDYCNIACRQTVDRGPSVMVPLYLDDLLSSGQSMTTETLKTVLTLFFGPALTSNNRAPASSLVKLMTGMLERIYNSHQKQQPNSI